MPTNEKGKEVVAIESDFKEGRGGKFDLEEFIFERRFQIIFLLLGLILVGLGIFYFKSSRSFSGATIEVLDSNSEISDEKAEIVAEISGAVENPGVYKLTSGSRIEDLLIASGGLSSDADRRWIEKMVNRAAKLTDGQKIYIPKVNEQTTSVSAKNSGLGEGINPSHSSLLNVNTATQKSLEDLPGIGPVYAQNIIEHRPYSSVEELVSKGVLKQHVYEKVKDLITVY